MEVFPISDNVVWFIDPSGQVQWQVSNTGILAFVDNTDVLKTVSQNDLEFFIRCLIN